MSLAVLGRRAPRMTLVNLATLERLVANANPPSLAWRVAVSWPRHEVPGRSSVPLQYGLTQNAEVPTLELALDRRLPEAAGGTFDVGAVQGFLQKLTLPSGAAGATKAPPSVLLVWPGLVTIEAVVTSYGVEYRDIGIDGQPLLTIATLAFEAVMTAAGDRARGRR